MVDLLGIIEALFEDPAFLMGYRFKTPYILWCGAWGPNEQISVGPSADADLSSCTLCSIFVFVHRSGLAYSSSHFSLCAFVFLF